MFFSDRERRHSKYLVFGYGRKNELGIIPGIKCVGGVSKIFFDNKSDEVIDFIIRLFCELGSKFVLVCNEDDQYRMLVVSRIE